MTEYVPRIHRVAFGGMIDKEVAKVKQYTLFPGADFSFWAKTRAGAFVADELVSGNINPRSGLGFMILSEGLINVLMWGKEPDYPSLLFPSIYSFKQRLESADFIPDFKKEDPRELGSLCCWEGTIIGYESQAWRRYLFSKQTEEDKQTYLQDIMRGQVIDP